MNLDQWLQILTEIIVDVNSRGAEPFSQRELLFGLWSHFMRAPPLVRRAFERVDEEALVGAGISYGRALLAGQAITAPRREADLRDIVTFAGCLLRGLEQAYLRAGGYTRAPRRAAELATAYRGEEGFVLPFPPLFRDSGRVWPPYFARRGLAHTRCIRKVLSTGHQIELVISEPLSSTDPVRCVGAMFERAIPLDAHGAPIDFTKTGKFIFGGIESEPPTIEAALLKAMSGAEPADIIVFPELTMPPERLAELTSLLRRKPWNRGSSPRGPALVVGGSWHQPNGRGGYANEAPVLASNGRQLGVHAKHMPYTRDALVEDIEPSDRILVVATPNLTAAVAICLDFCQEGEPDNPYTDLDVDLVLVPSMGSDTTIGPHKRSGERLWNLRKTATFVVQQSEKASFGFVYARSAGRTASAQVNRQISRRRLVTKG